MIRYIFLLVIFGLTVALSAQKPEKELPKSPAGIQLKTNSRNQSVVLRNNQHQRRDMRFVKMNKTLKMNAKRMKALRKAESNHPDIKGNKDLLRQNNINQQKMLQKKMLEKKRAQRLKQQIRQRRTR